MNKRAFLIIGAVILVGVLVAGVYTAVQLLAQPEEETAVRPVGRVMETVNIVNGGDPISVRTTILPAEELPDAESDAFGVVARIEDDNLIVGTGNINLEVDVEVNGETGQESTTLIPTTDGPEVEVVITNNTIIYKDVTDLKSDPPTESGERTIEQQVRQVDSSDDIDVNSEVEVWGEKRGDRIVAEVLVFGPLGGGAFD
ncbi:MAG: hypothetical protein AAF614_26410 [Chloroflexota bacterium]